MSDKPLVQQKLADDLADLLLVVRTAKADGRVARVKSALAFLEAFWHIVIREWSGLDRLRSVALHLYLSRTSTDGVAGWTNITGSSEGTW